MTIDIRLLKAAPDAASHDRLATARAIADDPNAARRALSATSEERFAHPGDYLGAITEPIEPHDSAASPSWGEFDEVEPLTANERTAAFDSLDEATRSEWIVQFRAVAHEWLDATAAEFADAGTPRALGWHLQTKRFTTVDGGQLIVCAQADDACIGVEAWFEAAHFVLPEVAEAAGLHEPTRLDAS